MSKKQVIKMKIIYSLFVVTISMYILVPIHAFMNMEDFREYVLKQWKCYGKNDLGDELINGQVLPIPNTIEAFVSILEKIEDANSNWTPSDIIKRILISFRFDDAIYEPISSKFKSRDGVVVKVYEILNVLVDHTSSVTTLRKGDILTREERCALYFMISHTVNQTAKPGEKFDNFKKLSKYPKEQGVINHQILYRSSFALGKVLLGLLAALQGNKDVKAAEIFRKLTPIGDISDILENVKINPLYAATFADILSMTKLRIGKSGDSLFYGNGRWTDSVCPTTYILSHKTETPDNDFTATYSLIRGAMDGYILGGKVREMMGIYKNLRISQILRYYYRDVNGISQAPIDSYTWRDRFEVFFYNTTTMNQLREKAIAYDKLFTRVSGQAGEDQDSISKDIDIVLKAIMTDHGRTRDILNVCEQPDHDGGCINALELKNKHCDTPADIFVVLDYIVLNQYAETIGIEAIGNVTSGFEMGKLGSTASVFTNLKGHEEGFKFGIDTLLENGLIAGCAGCAARHYKPLKKEANNDIEVVNGLNRALSAIQNRTAHLPAVNAKVVLYLNHANPISKDVVGLIDALKDLKSNHSLTRIFAFVADGDMLNRFPSVMNPEQDLYVNVVLDKEKIKALNEQICTVPAQFQYNNCKTDGVNFRRFITPQKYQYWMMGAKYFLKSDHVQIAFKSLTGNLRTCFSRQFTFEDKVRYNENCKDITPDDSHIIYIEKPCKEKTVETCDPFYFYIEGQKSSEICTDMKCKNPDDIQYEVYLNVSESCVPDEPGNNNAVALSCSTSVFFWLFAAIIISIYGLR